MSSAGTILDAIKKINQNRALARRRRALMRHNSSSSFVSLEYKRDPNRVEMTNSAKQALKDKIRKEIRFEQRRDWIILTIGTILLLSILWYYIMLVH